MSSVLELLWASRLSSCPGQMQRLGALLWGWAAHKQVQVDPVEHSPVDAVFLKDERLLNCAGLPVLVEYCWNAVCVLKRAGLLASQPMQVVT